MKTKFYVHDNVTKAKIIPEFEKTILGEIASRCRHTTTALLGMFCSNFGIRVPDTFSAQAECIDSDKFDEEFGKGLAQQKAVYKYHKAMRRKYQVILDFLGEAIYDISKLEQVHNKKCLRIEEDYKRYYLGEK